MTDRHLPPWDTPVSGYDAGSIGQQYLRRFFPEAFRSPYRDDPRLGEAIHEIERMLRDALEYGADQVRFKFLYPRSCSIYLNEGDKRERIGHYHECRFCGARTAEQYSDSIEHAATCALVATRGIVVDAGDCTIIKR